MSESTTTEPEWLTSLRQDMRTKIGDTPVASGVDVIAEVATRVAAAKLRVLFARIVNLEDEAEDMRRAAGAHLGSSLANATANVEARSRERARDRRIVELEADVRALGGDPDHMVDHADHGAAITAMREAMQPDRVGLDLAAYWISVDRARDIAEEHMLRMTQALAPEEPIYHGPNCNDGLPMSPEGTYVCTGCADAPGSEVQFLRDRVDEQDQVIAALTERLRISETLAVPAPVVREVPASEAREVHPLDVQDGDDVTVTGKACVHKDNRVGIVNGGVEVGFYYRACGSGVTVSRPVSPLPTERGVFGSISPFGSGHRFNVMTVERDGQLLFVASNGSEYHPHEVTDFLPAGAGVPEGGRNDG